jgi:hypothetical protein
MLRQLFTTDEVADGFKGRMSIAVGSVPLGREIQYLQRDIAGSVRELEGILERLPYFDVAAGTSEARPVLNDRSAPRCGFHGFWPPCFTGNGHPVSPETATLFHG